MNRIHKLTIGCCSFLASLTIAFFVPAVSATNDEGWTKLFNGRDLSGWKRYLDTKKAKDGDLDKIWTVKDGVIYCEGSINGYIVTEKEYGNYVIKLEGRWGDSDREKKNPDRGG